MSRTRGNSKLTDFLGALLATSCWVIVIERAVAVLQRNGGAYGNAGMAGAVCILVAMTALAVAICFRSRWRQARAEAAGALLGLAAAITLVLCVRYGA